MEGDRTAGLIRRAACRKVVDFSRFDPLDSRQQLRLRLLTHELDLEAARNQAEALHTHWLFRSLTAPPELREAAAEQAVGAFQDILRSLYPWLADILKSSEAATGQVAVETAHAERFGRPGEPRYEAMVDNVLAAIKRGKLTQREKEQRRKQRQERFQQA